MKYDYILKDKNDIPFSRVSDDLDIKGFLKRINGVYYKLVWLLKINNKTKEKTEYLIHQTNGKINEYAIMYVNGKKVN